MDLLNGMQVFVRVVESGSFTAAADALELSKAQVSRLIADLESHLQARLLQRTTRRLMLTDSGEHFLQRCRVILDEVKGAELEARGAHLAPSGRLRVHSMSGLGVLFTPLIAHYNQQYPQVMFELTLSQNNPDPLEDERDLVIALGQQLPDSQLVAQPVGEVYSVLCAAPAYLWQQGVPDDPQQLAKHRCLRLVEPQSKDDWLFQQGEQVQAILPGKVFQTNVAEAMVQATQAGMGISLLPLYAASAALRDGRLLRVLPQWRLRQRHVYAIYPSRRYLDAKVRTWIEFLKAELPNTLAEHQRLCEDPAFWARAPDA